MISFTNLERDNTSNKRLHIQLNHQGILYRDKAHKIMLDSIWKEFGEVNYKFYNKDYTYCIISYNTHDEAVLALSGINNSNRIKYIIVSILETMERLDIMKANQLFVRETNSNTILTAKWAVTKDTSRYEFDFNDYFNEERQNMW